MQSSLQLEEIDSGIQSIKKLINSKPQTLPTTVAELAKQQQENNEMVSRIYQLMLIQHSKLRLYLRQKSHLEAELDKLTASYSQLKQKYKKTQLKTQDDHKNQSNSKISKKIERLSLSEGVFIILHFKEQSTFQEAVPYLSTKAQFFSIQQFLKLKNNMQEAGRTSSRVDLQMSSNSKQLNQKIDFQMSTIDKMRDEIQELRNQNKRLREEDRVVGDKNRIDEIEALKSEKKLLESQLSNEKTIRRRLSQELNLFKNQKGGRMKSPTVIYRR